MDVELNLHVETVDGLASKPVLVTAETPLRDVLVRLKEQNSGAVLICRDRVLIGIFTERDALRVMAGSGSIDVPIESVMTRQPATIRVGATLAQAIQTMASGGFRRLPIIDTAGVPTGMLKVSGLVHFLVEHFPKTIYNLPPVAGHPTLEREGP